MKTNTLDFDAQALREKILDLAMRGKLVPQDPSDEPASVLLEKIKAEKAELVKEKKIKKSKPLPVITDDEKPFDIPDSWEWVRLNDVGVWAAGATPSRRHPEYYGGNIPWLKTGDLNDGVVNETTEKITELGVKNSSVKVNKPGNVLIAMYGATIGKLGIVGSQELVTNQACCGCSLFDGVYNWYLFYYLLSSRKRLIDLGSGGAQPNISKNKIEKFTFPLPPLSEQSRIAAKIAQLFALLRKVETSTQQYAELQTLLKSKMLDLAMRGKLVKQDPNDEPASVLLEKIKAEKAELVKEKKIKKSKPLSPITDEEKPFDIPDSWEWVRLGDISNFMNGFAYKSKLYVKKSNNQVIRLGNVKNDQLIVDKKQVFIDDDYADATNNYRIKKGDLLFTMTGTRNKRDYFFTLLVNEKDLNNHNLYLNQRVGCLNYIFGVNKLWLNYILKSQTILDEVFKNETGTVNQGNIGATKTMQIVIPLPPLSEQRRIATRIEQLDKLL